jgi:hypothetical protein
MKLEFYKKRLKKTNKEKLHAAKKAEKSSGRSF